MSYLLHKHTQKMKPRTPELEFGRKLLKSILQPGEVFYGLAYEVQSFSLGMKMVGRRWLDFNFGHSMWHKGEQRLFQAFAVSCSSADANGQIWGSTKCSSQDKTNLFYTFLPQIYPFGHKQPTRNNNLKKCSPD